MTGRHDFSKSPFLVIWETTHACDLACVHCRAEAEPDPDPEELTHEEARKLIDDVKAMATPIFIFSGGDPMKRKDLTELIRYAKSLGLRTGAIPAATPLLTEERIRELKAAGLDQMALSLDADTAAEHDGFRRAEGVFERTLERLRFANSIGLPVQINSLINVHNTDRLGELIKLVESLNIVFWEVFFLVPAGRGRELPLLSAEKFDGAFARIYELHQRAKFIVKVTEAPHYRKYYYDREQEKVRNSGGQKAARPELPGKLKVGAGPGGSMGRAPSGVNAGKGFVFVSCRGEVMPSGFLAIGAGNAKKEDLGKVYREAPLFRELRDTSLLKGRCGRCPYREMCGGSRSRAYVLTGDYLAEDPCCSYQPEAAQTEVIRP